METLALPNEQVQEVADVTAGGVLLPDSAKERPIAGEVVATGPGHLQEDNTRKSPRVSFGDKVNNVFRNSGSRWFMQRRIFQAILGGGRHRATPTKDRACPSTTR